MGSGVSVGLNNLIIDGGENGVYLAGGSMLAMNQVIIKNVTDSGISSNGASSIRVTESKFQNIGSYGINLYSSSQVELICGCDFSEIQNIPIFINQGSKVDSLYNCTIAGAGGASGDAVLVYDGSSVVAEKCEICQATAGFAVLDNSSAIIIDCNIHDNVKRTGSNVKGQGVYAQFGSNVEIYCTIIADNDNAGLFCWSSNVKVYKSTFDHNGWNALDGEGIDCRGNSTGYIYDSKITNNYLFGIQRMDSSIIIERCEIRNNRLGGVNIGVEGEEVAGQDAIVKGCIMDSNFNGSSPVATYETVLSGSLTEAEIQRCYLGYNQNIGILAQGQAGANVMACLLAANSNNNINVYFADIEVTLSSLSESNYGIYFNTANSSCVHNSDFFCHNIKHAQSQDSNPWPNCSNNWWGGSEPSSFVQKIIYEPISTERFAFTCLDRGYDLYSGEYKQFIFADLPSTLLCIVLALQLIKYSWPTVLMIIFFQICLIQISDSPRYP